MDFSVSFHSFPSRKTSEIYLSINQSFQHYLAAAFTQSKHLKRRFPSNLFVTPDERGLCKPHL
jgi:hypothetical protein